MKHAAIVLLFLPVLAAPANAAGPAPILQPSACSKFPIKITTPGSYILNSNLDVAKVGTTSCANPQNITAILVTTPGPVSINLNGFAIEGPVTCTSSGSPPKTSCSPSGGNGIGIDGATAVRPAGSMVRVSNGFVTGMGSHGVELGAASQVQDMVAASNGGAGIRAAVLPSTIIGCVANLNGSSGLFGGAVTSASSARNGGGGISGRTVANSTATLNGSSGIGADVVSQSDSSANGGIGIGATSVTASAAESNHGAGISALSVVASSALHNGAAGISANTVSASDSMGNGGDGIDADVVSASEGSANSGNGISGLASTGSIVSALSAAEVTVTGSIANQNGAVGIAAETVTGSTVNSNARDGIEGTNVNASFSLANRFDGINSLGEASNNASFNNGGSGLEMNQRFMGYFANVGNNNKGGAVFEGTSMGNNLCDGSAC